MSDNEQDSGQRGDSSRSENPHLWEITWVRDLFLLAVLAAGLFFIWWLRAIFQPLFLGLLFAYLLNPIVAWCERQWGWRRLPVVLALTAGAVLGAVSVSLAVVPLLLSQASELASSLPDYADAIAKKIGVSDEVVLDKIREQAAAYLKDPISSLSYVWDGFVASFGVVSGVVGTVASLAMGLALFPVYLVFFSWKLPTIADSLNAFVPASSRNRTDEVLRMMDAAVGGYFRTRLIIALIMGSMYAAGWGIAGVPYWLLLGLMGGLLGIIPYAALFAWLTAMLLQYLELESGIQGAADLRSVFLWPTLVYALVQASDDWLLTPWLQGQELDMSFLTIILAVLIGGAVAGLLGMLLAVPVAACVSIFWAEVLRPRLIGYAESH